MRLDLSQPIREGTFIVWVEGKNAQEKAVLKKIAQASTTWEAFTAAITTGYNAANKIKRSPFRISFPRSQVIGKVWVPRKGYDEKKGALYFLVKFSKG